MESCRHTQRVILPLIDIGDELLATSRRVQMLVGEFPRHRSSCDSALLPHAPVAHRKHPGLGTEASAAVPDTGRGRPQRTRDVKNDDETFRNNSALALATTLARAVLVGKATESWTHPSSTRPVP